MDDDPEFFPCQASADKEVIETYFPQEFDFMSFPYVFEDPRLRNKRAEALSTVVQLTRNRNHDVYIPYLAMNYYDRYVSRNPAPSRRKNSVAAICCLILAFKMRDKEFCVIDFKQAENLRIGRKTLEKVELEIFQGLDWRLWSITPFSFLQYYYPRYKELGGFKWSSIVKIIIEAQADNNLARYKHSEIASSSLMAAAAIMYPREFLNNFVDDVDGAPSLCHLIQMCGTKNIKIQHAEPRTPKKDEASTSYNANDSLEAEPPDDQAIRRRPGKEVISFTSQIDDDLSIVRDDDQAFIRIPGREFMASTSKIDDDPLAVIRDDQAIVRRPGSEFMASTSKIDDGPSIVRDDQAIVRRPGSEFMVSTSKIDDDPLAVTDEQEFSRRPGKEVVTISQSDPSVKADDDEQEDPRSLLKELGFTSETIDSFLEFTEEQDDPKSRLRKLGFTSRIIDPLFAVTDEQEIPSTSGSLAVFTSQGESSEDKDELEIPKNPIQELPSSSQITHPLSVTDGPGNPCGSSGSMVAFPSQGNSSAVTDELEIPRRPEKQTTFTSQSDPPEVTEEQEIPRRPGKEEVPTTSGVKDEQQIIPSRQGKEEERRRLVAALDAALEAGLKAAQEDTNENQQNLLETSQRFTKEVESATSSLLARPETSETETSRRFITTLQSLFDASQRSIRIPSGISDRSGFEGSQRFAKEVESARGSLPAHPTTSETGTSRRFITTLRSLFDASRRFIRIPSEVSELSLQTPPLNISDMSGFEASESNVDGGSANSENSEPEEEVSRNRSLGRTQPPWSFEIETPPVHLPPSSPPPPYASPSSPRNLENCYDRVNDRFKTCCSVM